MTEEEFGVWIEENQGLIVKIAKSYIIPGMDLEDKKQECFFAATKAWKQYDPSRGAKFSTYIFRVVKTHMNQLYRKANAKSRKNPAVEYVASIEEMAEKEGEKFEIPSKDESVEKQVMDAQLRNIVNEVLKHQPPVRRKALFLLIQQEYTQRECGKIIGVSQATISNWLEEFRMDVLALR